MKLLYTFIMAMTAAALSAQPMLVEDIFPGDESRPREFHAYNGQLIFRAEAPDIGVEPWISDGTADGTFLLREINEDPESAAGNSNPSNFINYKGLVWFKADDGIIDDELWVTDGTTEGTQLFLDIQPGEGNGNPFDFVVFNELLYFTANDGDVSSELWVTDGTVEGTQLVIDIQEGAGPGNPNFKTVVGDRMFFTANDGIAGNELWVSDGTAAGTQLVKDIRPDGNASPSRYIAYNGEVYFRANDGTNGTELWKSDGTEAGTVLVKDINPDGSSSPVNFFVLGQWLFFEADNGVNGDELWVTDGTEAGTQLLADINPGEEDGNPGDFVATVNESGYFVAEDIENGEELWFISTDGASNYGEIEISLFQDINPGAGDSNPGDLTFSGSALYFGAEEPDFGQELYELPVGEESATRISDINPNGDSDIDDIIQVGSRLFFEATNGESGDELWTLEVPTPDFMAESGGLALASGDTIDFGTVVIGSAAERSLELTNAGDGVLFFEEGNLAAPLAPFSLQSVFPELLPGDDAAFLVYRFMPVLEGTFQQELAVQTSDPNQPEFRVVLRGEAEFATATLDVTLDGDALESGTEIDFGTVEIGMEATEEIAVENQGNVALLVTGFELSDSDNFFVTELEAPLAPGTQDTFLIGFRPTVEGPLSTTLTINSSANQNGTFVFNLSGEGDMMNSTRQLGPLSVEAFPNPVLERVYLKLGNGLSNGRALLYNQQGQLIWQQPVPDAARQIDFGMGALPTGQYYLELHDGERRGTIELMKQ